MDEADIIPMAFGHPAVRVQSLCLRELYIEGSGRCTYNYFYLLVIRHDQSPALYASRELAPLPLINDIIVNKCYVICLLYE